MANAKKTAKKAPAKKAPAKKAPAKKAPAARKAVPKRSASYGLAVDAWVAKLDGWQRQAVEELVRLVRAAAPGATDVVKWSQPVFDQGGPFAFVRAATGHVTLGFWRGAELADPEGILQGDGERMRHVKIARGDAIPVTLLERLVREAVRRNAEAGDPTKKAGG